MKKMAIVLGCLLVASTAFADGPKVDGGRVTMLGGALDCTGATEMTCGDSATGVLSGLGNVANYGCTTLSYADAGEAVYKICVADATTLTVDMTYTHTSGANDLDLFLLGSCNEADCLDSSTGVSGTEQVSAAVAAGDYYVVVDGWNGLSDGSGHAVSVTCDAPCTPVSVEPQSWGSVKALYNE